MFKVKGDWSKTINFLKRNSKPDRFDEIYKEVGEMGVEALLKDTPKRTGKTANSWTYKIIKEKDVVTIEWHNDNITRSYNIALLLQQGHGTGFGGYVHGRDYINPAMYPVLNYLGDAIWKEVTKNK